jgi:hypothetical protein
VLSGPSAGNILDEGDCKRLACCALHYKPDMEEVRDKRTGKGFGFVTHVGIRASPQGYGVGSRWLISFFNGTSMERAATFKDFFNPATLAQACTFPVGRPPVPMLRLNSEVLDMHFLLKDVLMRHCREVVKARRALFGDDEADVVENMTRGGTFHNGHPGNVCHMKPELFRGNT